MDHQCATCGGFFQSPCYTVCCDSCLDKPSPLGRMTLQEAILRARATNGTAAEFLEERNSDFGHGI